MIFPIQHIPVLGDGMTIALDAVLHVLISHGMAIGLVAMLAMFQTLAYLGKGEFWMGISRSLLGPAVVVTTSVGAVTGVGIWFTTGALAPEGIGSLIHLFFWPWFIEWGVFTAEVILLLIYYFMWEGFSKDRPGLLLALAWGYVIMAVFSAILITGILGFMLTPDGWPFMGGFSRAYFNPTFIPQCFLRVSGGVAIGALIVMAWTVWRFKGPEEERRRALRLAGAAGFGAVLVAAVSAFVYFSRVPETYLTHWKFAVATSALSQRPALLPIANTLAALCLLAMFAAGFLRRARLCRILAVPALLLCVGLVAEFERIREFVRGPYLLPGYMYANQVLLVKNEAVATTGGPFLPSIRWLNDNGDLSSQSVAAQALFAANCGVCHTEGGINDIRERFAGRTLEGVNAIIGITQNLAPFMTPFTGSDEERLLMAQYLYRASNPDSRLRRPDAKEK